MSVCLCIHELPIRVGGRIEGIGAQSNAHCLPLTTSTIVVNDGEARRMTKRRFEELLTGWRGPVLSP